MAGSKPCVPVNMVNGEKFIKWLEDSPLVIAVTLRVDKQGYFLYWTDQNGATEALDMNTVRDARTGQYAQVSTDESTRDQITKITGVAPYLLQNRTLTVAHGSDFVNTAFINFTTLNKDADVKQWAESLVTISYSTLSLNGSALYFLRKAYVRLTLQASREKISVKDIVQTFALDRPDRQKVKKALIDSTGISECKDECYQIALANMSFEVFFTLYQKILERREIDIIFGKLFSRKTNATVDQFLDFLNCQQREPRRSLVFQPLKTYDQAREILTRNDPHSSKGRLSRDGFLRFLMSDDNPDVSSDQFELNHDMQRPLSDYFINSSHNTYLTGDQIRDRSSVEIYRQVLLSGCRCVELDFWNGKNDEPVIYHGYTLVPEVLAKDVIEAIAESAFKTSDYPLILSFENHCNAKQQVKIAQYCREFFGDMLLDSPLESHPLRPGVQLPSPSQLKRKIIIKNKKKPNCSLKYGINSTDASTAPAETAVPPAEEATPGESGTTERNGDIATDEGPCDEVETDPGSEDENAEPPPKALLTQEEIRTHEEQQMEKGTARSETEAGEDISAMVNYVQPVHFCSFQHAERRNRSYEMSSLVETQATALLREHPVEFLNYNKRQMSRIYPRGTRVDSSNFMPQLFWNVGCQMVALNFQTLDLPMQLNLGAFELNGRSGYLLKPQIMRRPDRLLDPFTESTIDGIVPASIRIEIISGQFISDKRWSTYVEANMFGLFVDMHKKYKTKMVLDNGLNPVYDGESFLFDRVVLPELAFLRVAVHKDSGRLIGQRVLPVMGLFSGYRHICLRNSCGQPLGLATLFVKITVQDYVPSKHSAIVDALANPIKYQSDLETRSKLLRAITEHVEGRPVASSPRTNNQPLLQPIRAGSQQSVDEYSSSTEGSPLAKHEEDHGGCTPSSGVPTLYSTSASVTSEEDSIAYEGGAPTIPDRGPLHEKPIQTPVEDHPRRPNGTFDSVDGEDAKRDDVRSQSLNEPKQLKRSNAMREKERRRSSPAMVQAMQTTDDLRNISIQTQTSIPEDSTGIYMTAL